MYVRKLGRCVAQRGFARCVGVGCDGCFERRLQPQSAIQTRERAAEPLAVRRVSALHQEGEPHHVPDDSSRDQAAAEFVPDLGAASDEALFLPDPLPLAREPV